MNMMGGGRRRRMKKGTLMRWHKLSRRRWRGTKRVERRRSKSNRNMGKMIKNQ
jgi:hypothetical protein